MRGSEVDFGGCDWLHSFSARVLVHTSASSFYSLPSFT